MHSTFERPRPVPCAPGRSRGPRLARDPGPVSRRRLQAGINAVTNAVKVTLGPKGRNVVLQRESFQAHEDGLGGQGVRGCPKKRGAEAGGLVKRRRRADFWYLASLVVFHLEGTPETFGLVERGSRIENHMPRCTSQAFRVESSCSGASDCQRWRDHRPGYFLTGPLWSSERLRLHPGLGVQGRGQAGKAAWKLRKRRRVLFI